MNLYTLNKHFDRTAIIDEVDSLIWTERYFGDGECEVVVSVDRMDLVNKLLDATFLSLDESDEPMIIETFTDEDGKMKFQGISILSWMNNRFIRNNVDQRKKQWKIAGKKPGELLWFVLRQMVTDKSTIIGTNTMGLGSAARERELVIPNLKLDRYDTRGRTIKKIFVPYGPLYDGLRGIAEHYAVGMQITLRDDDKSLRFRSYSGLNRSHNQNANPLVRFSPSKDSLSRINEVRSSANFKTLVYSYASALEKIDTADNNSNPDTWLQQDNKPGIARRTREGGYTGFDLRAKIIFSEDFQIKNDLDEEDKNGPEDTVPQKRAETIDVLNNRADKELKQNKRVQTVDGEISPDNLYKYGVHYGMGDIIEIQGHTGLVEISRVTEYIRSKDSEGERSYPTVVSLDS
jgi:hypothetical protein